MSLEADPFITRDERVMSDRLDDRLDLVAGLRYVNFVAAANLRMSAGIDSLEQFREKSIEGGSVPSLTALVGRALMLALTDDPLFGCLFDGRDRLVCPERPTLGVSVDTGDRARVFTVPDAGDLGLDELGSRIERAGQELKSDSSVQFRQGTMETVSKISHRTRWLRIVTREVRERFDYLLPVVQSKRFDSYAKEHGHICLHNIGPLDVQDFKGFLRRPAVAALWVLSAFERVVASRDGDGFESERRLPLMLVYSQEIIPVDRACRFLGAVVAGLENPVSLK